MNSMKIEKVIERDYAQSEQESIEYNKKWFGKMNMAFVGEHCAVVLSKSDKDEMVNNCLEIIEEVKNGPQICTAHVLEDGRGMLIMGSDKYYIHAITPGELSDKEIDEDKMSEESIELLKGYCQEALEKPEILALGCRHKFINFMEDHYAPIITKKND